jgi:hypothetical protein
MNGGIMWEKCTKISEIYKKISCVINQMSLCGKTLKYKRAVNVVMWFSFNLMYIITAIFYLLSEINAEYGNHTEFRWLSGRTETLLSCEINKNKFSWIRNLKSWADLVKESVFGILNSYNNINNHLNHPYVDSSSTYIHV